jgi:hypothetical protein
MHRALYAHAFLALAIGLLTISGSVEAAVDPTIKISDANNDCVSWTVTQGDRECATTVRGITNAVVGKCELNEKNEPVCEAQEFRVKSGGIYYKVSRLTKKTSGGAVPRAVTNQTSVPWSSPDTGSSILGNFYSSLLNSSETYVQPEPQTNDVVRVADATNNTTGSLNPFLASFQGKDAATLNAQPNNTNGTVDGGNGEGMQLVAVSPAPKTGFSQGSVMGGTNAEECNGLVCTVASWFGFGGSKSEAPQIQPAATQAPTAATAPSFDALAARMATAMCSGGSCDSNSLFITARGIQMQECPSVDNCSHASAYSSKDGGPNWFALSELEFNGDNSDPNTLNRGGIARFLEITKKTDRQLYDQVLERLSQTKESGADPRGDRLLSYAAYMGRISPVIGGIQQAAPDEETRAALAMVYQLHPAAFGDLLNKDPQNIRDLPLSDVPFKQNNWQFAPNYTPTVGTVVSAMLGGKVDGIPRPGNFSGLMSGVQQGTQVAQCTQNGGTVCGASSQSQAGSPSVSDDANVIRAGISENVRVASGVVGGARFNSRLFSSNYLPYGVIVEVCLLNTTRCTVGAIGDKISGLSIVARDVSTRVLGRNAPSGPKIVNITGDAARAIGMSVSGFSAVTVREFGTPVIRQGGTDKERVTAALSVADELSKGKSQGEAFLIVKKITDAEASIKAKAAEISKVIRRDATYDLVDPNPASQACDGFKRDDINCKLEKIGVKGIGVAVSTKAPTGAKGNVIDYTRVGRVTGDTVQKLALLQYMLNEQTFITAASEGGQLLRHGSGSVVGSGIDFRFAPEQLSRLSTPELEKILKGAPDKAQRYRAVIGGAYALATKIFCDINGQNTSSCYAGYGIYTDPSTHIDSATLANGGDGQMTKAWNCTREKATDSCATLPIANKDLALVLNMYQMPGVIKDFTIYQVADMVRRAQDYCGVLMPNPTAECAPLVASAPRRGNTSSGGADIAASTRAGQSPITSGTQVGLPKFPNDQPTLEDVQDYWKGIAAREKLAQATADREEQLRQLRQQANDEKKKIEQQAADELKKLEQQQQAEADKAQQAQDEARKKAEDLQCALQLNRALATGAPKPTCAEELMQELEKSGLSQYDALRKLGMTDLQAAEQLELQRRLELADRNLAEWQRFHPGQTPPTAEEIRAQGQSPSVNAGETPPLPRPRPTGLALQTPAPGEPLVNPDAVREWTPRGSILDCLLQSFSTDPCKPLSDEEALTATRQIIDQKRDELRTLIDTLKETPAMKDPTLGGKNFVTTLILDAETRLSALEVERAACATGTCTPAMQEAMKTLQLRTGVGGLITVLDSAISWTDESSKETFACVANTSTALAYRVLCGVVGGAELIAGGVASSAKVVGEWLGNYAEIRVLENPKTKVECVADPGGCDINRLLSSIVMVPVLRATGSAADNALTWLVLRGYYRDELAQWQRMQRLYELLPQWSKELQAGPKVPGLGTFSPAESYMPSYLIPKVTPMLDEAGNPVLGGKWGATPQYESTWPAMPQTPSASQPRMPELPTPSPALTNGRPSTPSTSFVPEKMVIEPVSPSVPQVSAPTPIAPQTSIPNPTPGPAGQAVSTVQDAVKAAQVSPTFDWYRQFGVTPPSTSATPLTEQLLLQSGVPPQYWTPDFLRQYLSYSRAWPWLAGPK